MGQRKLVYFFLAAVIACVGVPRPASADITVYAATANGDFGWLNLDTGAYTSIGPSGADQSIVGMGFIDGTLYGAGNNPAGAGFYSINPATGAASLINDLSVTAYGGTTALGNFYGVTQDDPTALFQSNTAGSASVINTTPDFAADGLVALDSLAENLYISAFTGAQPEDGGDDLYRINIDGSVHFVGALYAQAITGLIFGETLYTSDGSFIYTYSLGASVTNLSNGPLTTTEITGLNPNGDYLSSVASVAVPEPSTMLVACAGIAAVGLNRTRRRRSAA